MFRVILFLLFVAVIALALSTVWSALLQATSTIHRATRDDTMPDTFRRIAYVALIILMFGVAVGALGAG